MQSVKVRALPLVLVVYAAKHVANAIVSSQRLLEQILRFIEPEKYVSHNRFLSAPAMVTRNLPGRTIVKSGIIGEDNGTREEYWRNHHDGYPHII